jgi:hypothetical protein
VINVPGGSLMSPDSHWLLFLGGYELSSQRGELFVADLTQPSAERQKLGTQVTYYVTSDDSKQLAFVEDGVLKVGSLPAGPFRQVAGEVSTAEFSPDGATLYFRRRVAAAGGLFQVALGDEKKPPRKVTDQVGEFTLSPDGAHLIYTARPSLGAQAFELFVADTRTLKATRVSDRVLRYALSKDGKHLVRLVGDNFEQGGELFLGPVGEGEGQKLGERVKDFIYSPDGARLLFRQKYRDIPLMGQQMEKVGELMEVTLADGASHRIARMCPNYQFAPDSKTLALTQTVLPTTENPMYSRDLYLYRDGDKEPVKVKDWVYDYSFSPDAKRLYYRSNCTREGRACDLLAAEVAAPEKSKRLAEAVYSFRLSTDGSRAFTTYAHTTDESFDVSVLNLGSGQTKVIDQYVRLPPVFLAPDGSRLTYMVEEKSRAGLYVSDQVP